MKCKTKSPVLWVNLMVTKEDLKKHLLSMKDFISAQCTAFIQYTRPYLHDTAAKAVENKESIIKISVPLVLIWAALYSCSASQRLVAQNVSDIFDISDDIRFQYAGKPDYWGLSTQTVLQEKMISDSFIKDGKIHLAGGEEILIGNGANADVVMPRATSFDIVLPHLNKAQCISYAESKISKEDIVKLQRISISNSSGVYAFEWGSGKYQLPVKKYAGKDICTGSDNTLIWTIQ